MLRGLHFRVILTHGFGYYRDLPQRQRVAHVVLQNLELEAARRGFRTSPRQLNHILNQ